MNGLSRIGVLACLFVAGVAAQTDERVDMDVRPLRALMVNVRALLDQENFDQLEQIAADAASSKARLPGGDWKLSAFYRVVQGPGSLTDPNSMWSSHLTGSTAGPAAKPTSLTPRVALGKAYLRFAWKARGNGFSNTITEEAASCLWRACNKPARC